MQNRIEHLLNFLDFPGRYQDFKLLFGEMDRANLNEKSFLCQSDPDLLC